MKAVPFHLISEYNKLIEMKKGGKTENIKFDAVELWLNNNNLTSLNSLIPFIKWLNSRFS